MASSYEIKNGRLIFRNNGEDYIDDDEKKHISGSFTEIEFPSCFNELYDDDFKACRNQLSKVTKLDFTKATKIETIGDDTFTGASSLKVVVLPKKVTAINEFKKCPNLKEIHIYKLEDLYGITDDEDKRLTVYASRVSSDIDSFDNSFLADVGILYVPANMVRKLEKARDEYDDELDIRPLPDGYTFPTVALSEPWEAGGATTQSEEETKPCSNSGNDASDIYEVVLVSDGPAKLQLIKTINDACKCGLKEARDIVDSAPSSVIKNISKERAEEIKRAIEKVGGKANINCGDNTIIAETNDAPSEPCEDSNFGSCEVVLVSAGRYKLQLTKAIKEVCRYGLKQAKDIVDSAPSSVISNVSKEKAEKIKQTIESEGGKAEIKGAPTSSAAKAITLEDVYGGPQYYCVLTGQSFGPVTIRQFANMARFGIVDKNTMVWKNGMSNWALAQTVADLQVVL